MNQTARISVVIPTYNYARYVSRAIDSVIDQAVDCEIIVIDDGSNDDTKDVVSNYSNKNLLYIYQSNQGVSAARNHGARLASGDYILFLDADDSLLTDALSTFQQAINNARDIDCFLGGHVSHNDSGRTKTALPKPLSTNNVDNFANYLRKKLGSVATGAVLFSKPIFDKLSFPENISNNEDIVLLAQVLCNYHCQSLQVPVMHVTNHPDSLSHNIDSIMDSTYKVAEALFNQQILSAQCMEYKEEFSSRILLSRFRTLYINGRKRQSRQLYHQAIKLKLANVLLFSYFKKYLKSYF